jgi:hypothetical protein
VWLNIRRPYATAFRGSEDVRRTASLADALGDSENHQLCVLVGNCLRRKCTVFSLTAYSAQLIFTLEIPQYVPMEIYFYQ